MPTKKRPLTVADLWSIKRVGTPTLSPDGRHACATVTAFDMKTNEAGHTELWLFPCDGGKARAADRGRQGFRTAVVARRQVDRIHRQAQGRRRSAGLPDRAGRRRGATTDDACRRAHWRCAGFPTAAASPSCPGSGRTSPTTRRRRSASASARTSKIKAHVTERAEPRYWDHWLADGREPHVFAADVAQRQRARSARRHRARAAALGSFRRALRLEPRRQGARAHRRPGPGAADDEFRRHRRGQAGDRAPPHADGGQRIFQRASALFAGRQTSGLARVQPEARVQRSGPSDALRARAAAARVVLPPGSTARPTTSTGRPTARRCTC